MDVGEARVKIRILMREHGLEGWTLTMGTAKKVLGVTTPARHRIRMSAVFISLNDWDEVKRVVLHEIAHALIYLKHGFDVQVHGPEWAALAESIGADPKPKNSTAKLPASRYQAKCSVCGRVYHRERTPGNHRYGCSTCKTSAPLLVWEDTKIGGRT